MLHLTLRRALRASSKLTSASQHHSIRGCALVRVSRRVRLAVSTPPCSRSHATRRADLRRGYISGFTGSAGTAVVTQAEAALFTDGRYFLQAEQQLWQGVWRLMKMGESGVPTWQGECAAAMQWFGSVFSGRGAAMRQAGKMWSEKG